MVALDILRYIKSTLSVTATRWTMCNNNVTIIEISIVSNNNITVSVAILFLRFIIIIQVVQPE